MSNVISGNVPDTGLIKGSVHGIIGRDGYSAYELAQKHGFVGTEEEWLLSLNGVDGTVAFEDLTPAQRESLRGNPGVYIGSGNMPAGYNVQIDPNGDSFSADDLEQAISKPNMLDNWYWGNPVNQRGQTEYTDVGYSIDRWRVYNEGLIATVAEGYLRLYNSIGSTRHFVQKIEAGKIKDGDTISLSMLKADGTFYTATGKATGDVSAAQINYGEGSAYYNFTSSWIVFAIFANRAVDIKAVKIELGDKQTLAHQDANGNWVLNEIPDYGAELAKCQRYQLPLFGSIGAYGTLGLARVSGVSTKTAEMFVPIPVTMRANPTLVTGNAVFQMFGSESDYSSVNSVTFSAIAPGFARLLIATSKELTGGAVYALRKTTDDLVMLDANL